MDREPGQPEARAIAQEAHALWEQKAAFWDEKMEVGTRLHREVLVPVVERLLAVRPGDAVLDIACGNGQWSRRLAEAGATVVGCDFSAGLIERARARSTTLADRIEYRVLDATDAEALRSLGERRFDVALCNMALMDIRTLDPLMAALPRLLKPGGRFVFSVIHPCFAMPGSAIVAERGERGGEVYTSQALRLTRYLRIPPEKGLGIVGEPMPHYYFHRPLGELLGAAFRVGLMLDALEEPGYPEQGSHPSAAGPQDPLRWDNLDQFPYVLVARLRAITPPLEAERA